MKALDALLAQLEEVPRAASKVMFIPVLSSDVPPRVDFVVSGEASFKDLPPTPPPFRLLDDLRLASIAIAVERTIPDDVVRRILSSRSRLASSIELTRGYDLFVYEDPGAVADDVVADPLRWAVEWPVVQWRADVVDVSVCGQLRYLSSALDLALRLRAAAVHNRLSGTTRWGPSDFSF